VAEVSFSLGDISAAVQSSAPAEVQTPALTEEAIPSLPPSPETLPGLETELRQRARAISAEFEEDYRRSLGELLMRLRADLEEQAAADWERNRREAVANLEEAAQQVREQVEQESVARAASDAALAAQVEEVRQARDYVESLVRVLPETVDRRLQEAFLVHAEQWQNRLNEGLRVQLQEQCRALTEELATQVRQRLFDDFDRHEREFLDRIAVRLEEVRASADHTREFTKRTSAEIARQSEQLRVDLRTQFDSLMEERQRDLAERLEARHQQLSQAAHTALQSLGGRLWESLRAQLKADFETRSRELQQTLTAAQAETHQLRQRTERLAAQLDAGLQARLDQAVEDATHRTESQLQQLLSTAREESLRQLEANQEQARAWHLQTQQALVESLQAQRAALLAEFQRETETIAADSRLRFQTALRETLESIGKVLGTTPRLPDGRAEPGATDS
jgi:hypothetical protein